MRRRNWVSDDEVPADLDPAPQLDPGIPVPDFELLEAASRVLPALITEAFPRHDQGGDILSPEVRWRSLRDFICREVMFFDNSCADHRRCRSSGVRSCCSAGGATRETLSRSETVSPGARSSPHRCSVGAHRLTIFDVPMVRRGEGTVPRSEAVCPGTRHFTLPSRGSTLPDKL